MLLVPLHIFCIQHKQPPQLILTPQVSFSDFFSRYRLMPDTIMFVFPIFSRRPFFSISDFYVFTFSMDSALIIKSSAYSSSHGQPVQFRCLEEKKSNKVKGSKRMIQSFQTDRSEQTVQTQIRLLLEVRMFTVFHSNHMFWTH